ncbi:MAG: hypothetical protein LUE23_08185 [Lachnospiraceae bacterium]|nr:hypothetical protein [Lachnospiraceae bacterium]
MTEQMKEQILREDLEAIYIGNLNTVEEDLLLPERGHGGSCFTWKSSETRFIADDGTVHRPLPGQGNRELTLTVIASLEGRQAERSFPVTVLQEKKRKPGGRDSSGSCERGFRAAGASALGGHCPLL